MSVDTATFMVITFSVTTILSASLIQWTPYAISFSQVLQGLEFKLPAAGWGIALAVVGVVGLSPTELLYYPYWCLEKGYAKFTGPNEPSVEWKERAECWIKVMQLDCYVAMVVYTIATIAFYFLGAAVLHAHGSDPAGMDVVRTLSVVYTETFGPAAFYVFVAAAFFILFSTLFVGIASSARLMSDTLSLFGVFPASDQMSRQKWIRIFIVVFSTLNAGSSQVQGNPVLTIALGVSLVTLLLPMVCFAVMYLRYRCLDPRLRPSRFLDIWLWASVLFTFVLTLYTFALRVRLAD